LIYTSTDAGATWTPRFRVAAYNGIASSADGNTLALIVPANDPYESQGFVYVSSDAGATWTARESNRMWRGIAISPDGTRLLAAEYGVLIYTSP
jgi:photosystem II stability/assembly factor-like uncharacterized protein